MDPLSVAASIAGLLSAAGQVAKVLGPYVSAAKETPEITARVHAEVQSAAVILSALKNITNNLASVPAQCARLIQVDQVITILTDGVLLFSELEAALRSLPSQELEGSRLPLRARLLWARKESAFVTLLTRLQGFKSSVSLVLMILSNESDRLAAHHQEQLSINVNALLESNHALSRRLMNLEDACDIRSIAPTQPNLASTAGQTDLVSSPDFNLTSATTSQPSIAQEAATASMFRFEDDLEASRVYRRAQRDTMDFSFRSSMAGTNSWSVFSGLSLGDVSIMSVIALPVYSKDLVNSEHYDFGNGPQPSFRIPPHRQERPILYDCLEIQLQLCQIPGFPELFEEERDCKNAFNCLWAVLGKGFPLLMLLDAFDRDRNLLQAWNINPFPGTTTTKAKKAKRAVYMSLQVFADELGLQLNNIFTLRDLHGTKLSGFLKVIAVVSSTLDMLTQIGTLSAVSIESLLAVENPDDHFALGMGIVVEEFLIGQRYYVRQLEDLDDLRFSLEVQGNLTREDTHEIFSPLRDLLDFHIGLLVMMEMNLLKQVRAQRWSNIFSYYCSKASLEADYISNERRARDIIKLHLGEGEQHDDDHRRSLTESLNLRSLSSRRFPEYKAFLQKLRNQEGLSDYQQKDLDKSWHSLQEALDSINNITKEKEIQEAGSDLVPRVVYWQGYDPGTLGDLQLFDP
ncbi:hypothetical protein EDB80DRAFT_415205 [Ilyonectria destructans]|nr:hypothetical protein EDB80DRAFT_415205 [Ilyonectria destructans]